MIDSRVKVTRVLLDTNNLSLLSYHVTLTAAMLDEALHIKSTDFPSSMNELPLMLTVIGSMVKSTDDDDFCININFISTATTYLCRKYSKLDVNFEL